jgi:hypothetical protein
MDRITRENIDNLSFWMLQKIYETYYDENRNPVSIQDVINALPTVQRALQQFGSRNGVAEFFDFEHVSK